MDRRAMHTFEQVLGEELREPLYLSADEIAGGWRELFPELASCLGVPYPIYGRDEEHVVTHGYPVLVSTGVRKLSTEAERQVQLEVDYRLTSMVDRRADKRKLMSQRTRYGRSLTAIIENILINDYGRGLLEVFLLFHSSDILRHLGQVARLVQQHASRTSRSLADEFRVSIAGVFADLIQRSAVAAVDSLKRLSRVPVVPRLSPLLGVLCQDQLLLTETRPPQDLRPLSGYLQSQFGPEGVRVAAGLAHAEAKLGELLERQPELGEVLGLVTGVKPGSSHGRSLLEPRLLDALSKAGLTSFLELTPARLDLLRDMGLRLKCFELLWALRRRVLRMEMRGTTLVLAGASSATPIAPTTRPFDFASAGVVSSRVRRFGLVYDLTNFTALLENVRKKGRMEEERALQFMYLFQGQLEETRRRRRLTFEKFLGDGAFYTARRGLRVVAAACEIQQIYNSLRKGGFPFDQGLRMAMNYGSYQLLPMLSNAAGGQRFEFFGHGIVELARLTTGKSTREVEQIAEFLVHSGYNPATVESFLQPLFSARAGRRSTSQRSYLATLDEHGELINEGVVLTLPMLQELEAELSGAPVHEIETEGWRWVLFEVDPGKSNSLLVGLRLMGVARLKGLESCELVEAAVWSELPAGAHPISRSESLISLLRRLAANGTDTTLAEDPVHQPSISSDLVVLTFTEARDDRRWIFGEYRVADDVLLHAINVPLEVEDLEDDSQVEIWLLKHRFELATIYESLRRESSGVSTPLGPLRSREGYVACYLSAPHKGPG